MRVKKNTRRRIHHPGLLLDHLGIPDTDYNRRLLEQVDGVIVTDFSDGRCCVRALRRDPDGELFEPGSCWLIAYISDDDIEIKVKTYPEQQDDLPRAS